MRRHTSQWHHNANLTVVNQVFEPMDVVNERFCVHDACLDLFIHNEGNDRNVRSLHGDGMSI